MDVQTHAAVSTHAPVLRHLARHLRIRRVTEFGSGDYSTPIFLDREAFPDLEALVSWDSDAEWLARVRERCGGDPRLTLKLAPEREFVWEPADLFFMDSATAPGRVALLALAPPDALVVLHDAELECYADAQAAFAHRLVFTGLTPHTAVLSRSPLPPLPWPPEV